MSSGRAVVAAWAASVREAVVACMNYPARGRGRPGSVLVTGTSGKGTTCRMMAEVLRAARLHPVLAAEGELRHSRLSLCALSLRVLVTGLGLLGIPVPDRM